ncbi:hypothetical protein [Pararhizobium qamdonense]|nr:hypothetical protein [Pararhizobium qamdonense]
MEDQIQTSDVIDRAVESFGPPLINTASAKGVPACVVDTMP